MLTKFSQKVTAFLALAMMSACAYALDLPANKLVDAAWLNQNINDKDLVIVDIRKDTKAYAVSHIPNAVQWKIGEFRENRFDLPGFIGAPIAFKRLASKSGITPNSAVVFYSDGKANTSYTIAALSVFISEYYGITNTAILNGGLAGWEKAGFKVSADKTKVKKSKFNFSEFNPQIVATVPYMDEAVELENSALIDARPVALYDGTKQHPKTKKAGHVPGAANVFVGNLTEEKDGVFYIINDQAKIKDIFQAAKIDLNKPEIWYCNTGWFASGGWFVAKYVAGIKDVKNYEASMVEYTNLPKRKVIK